ncbi:energy transducer TonB [Bacteroidia bacterium]|nr:energy transducer TonB [Bacteroidia bacterium]MDB4107268.1 energy transducer TonB [Bacteroidia bacterium]MDB9882415.1 energy transducer TonB [Bacteroidia bacterium]MDC1395352.1 energy transducer TonB [Bacteroidia bacterium]
MQNKTNRTCPDRIILFEIGIILALLFVNFGLNITYGSDAILDSSSESDDDGEWYVMGAIEEPPKETPVEEKREKKVELASIFDPTALIKQVENIFDVKEAIIAPDIIGKLGPISPIVVKQRIDSSTKIVDFPDIQAEFPGGERALNKYIVDNLVIPDIVLEIGEDVNIIVEFVVDKRGNLSDFKVLKNSNPGLGTEREAKKLYMNMPKWTPGKNQGKPANVRLRQPIKIRID